MDKASILKAVDLKVEAVDVPEWGGTVYLREFSGVERDKVQQFYADNKDNDFKGIREFVCALSISDSGGNLLFNTSKDDLQELNRKSSLVLDRLMERALEMSGLSGDSDIDGAVKN